MANLESATRPTAVPGPPGRPLIGSLLDLRRDVLGTYLRARREYGDVVRFVAGPPGLRMELYGIFSPEGAQQVLAHDAARFRKDNVFYEEIRQALGNGLLTSQDADYLRQRRLVQPLFTHRRIETYAQAMQQEAAAVVDRWRAAPDGVVDVLDESVTLTLRVVARILFGTDVDAAIAAIRRSFPILGQYVRDRGIAPVRLPPRWPTPGNRRAAAAQRDLYEVCDRIIAQRRARGQTDPDSQADLLTLLVTAGDNDADRLAAAEIRDQVLIFLLAGHETTATAVAFALHLLAQHPEAEARACAEVDSVLGDAPADTTDLEALPYLSKVLKEAMRLYPPAPAIGRLAVSDVDVGGHRIPAGATVVVSPWVTHRHPDHWEDPERFDPERFTPEREPSRPRYAWFPFGGGPRACIGQHFSLLESVIALATVLQSYTLDAVDGAPSLNAGITLRVTGPLRCRLNPR